jgi:hypothetical protein
MPHPLFRINSGVLVLIPAGTCLRYFDMLRRVRVANTHYTKGGKVVCQLSMTGIVLANKSLGSEIDARNANSS